MYGVTRENVEARTVLLEALCLIRINVAQD
jgi:hypothetical protein